MHPIAQERPQSELSKYSFDARAEHENLLESSSAEIARQLVMSEQAYTAEVVTDDVCSPVYPIYFDRQHAYSAPEKKPKDRMDRQFDINEREGLPLLGFGRFTNEMKEHPGEVVMWYSRRGPAAFSENAGVYTDMKFDYDQCYVGVFDEDSNSSLVTAVKANQDEGTRQFFAEQFQMAEEHGFNTEDMIKYALVTPRTTGMTLDEFNENEWGREKVMYVDKEGKNYSVGDILDDVSLAFFNHHSIDITKTEKYLQIYTDAQLGLVDEQYIRNMYVDSIRTYMMETGKTKVALGGSCGGAEVTLDDLGGLAKSLQITMNSFMSSSHRALTQGNQVLNSNESGTHYESYKCPGCNTKLSGESKTDTASWRKNCPHCGYKLNCRDDLAPAA